MPKSSTPATEMQEAVSSAVSALMKAANHALVSIEDAHKEELRRTLQDVREAQSERDVLVQEKLAIAVELETARGESERWRAATEKAEWMINHQAETITQLRRESQQWKDQFVRVDEERQRLSARNDELVSQQLYANRRDAYYQEPMTPRSQGPQAQGSSSTRAISNQFASSSVGANGYATDGDLLDHRVLRDSAYVGKQRVKAQRNLGKQARSQPVASSSRRESQSQSASAQGKILRTVHVVMQGAPVKEESLDSVTLASAASGSESLGEDEGEVEDEVELPPPTQSRKRGSGKGKAISQGQSSRRRWSEGRRVHDEESESEGRTASEDNVDDYVPSPPKARARAADEEEDDDDDELMLGGEADRHGNYATPKVLVTPVRRAHTQPAKQANTSAGSMRKRNSPYPVNATGKKARNR